MIRNVFGITIMASLLWFCHTTQPLPQKDKPLNWKGIDSLEAIGKYQSAADECRKLYLSLPENAVSERTKALIYLAKYMVYLDARDQQAAILWLDKQAKLASGPVSSLIHSFVGEQIAAWADQNRWGRENLLPGAVLDTTDLQTWPLAELYHWAMTHYEASLVDVQGTSIPLTELGDLIVWDTLAEQFAPNLHYLLLDRALQFLQRPEATAVADESVLQDLTAAGPLSEFLAWQITGSDHASQVLRHFQAMLKYSREHLSAPLQIQTDLKRLNYAFNALIHTDKEAQFEATLSSMTEDDYPVAEKAWIRYTLTDYWVHTKSYLSEEAHAALNRKAHSEAIAIITDEPGVPAAQAAQALIDELETKECNVQMESVWLPDQPALLHVNYRNLSNVDCSIYRLESTDEWQRLDGRERKAWLERTKAFKVWTSKITDPKDYLRHSTEIPAPALPFGRYVLVVTSQNDRGEWIYAEAFQVSDIIYERNQKTPVTFSISSRSSGLPLAGVKGTLYKWDYGRNQQNARKSIAGTIETDSQGQVTTDNGNFQEVVWTLAKDTLESMDGNGYQGFDGVIQQNASVVLSDRSIYRPGQRMQVTVLFYQNSRSDRKVMVDQPVEIQLVDANQQIVSSMKLRTNGFGSVNTSFLLPSDRLAGNWSIQTPGYQGYYGFQVEAYKRPALEVTWTPDTSIHVLGDAITVTGHVRNLAGNPVQGATGKFTVYRQMPWFDYWRIPAYNRREQIAAGVVKVDDQGNFSFNYDALPDPYATQAKRPVTYHFSIEVEVTDLNGETQSNQQVQILTQDPVRVLIPVQDVLVDATEIALSWQLQNYSGQPLSISGNYQLVQLANPGRLIRRRLYPRPDMPVLSPGEFQKLFPLDAYQDEDNWQNWRDDQVIRHASWQSSTDGNVSINLTGLAPGAYRLEVIPEGQTEAKSGYFLVANTSQPLAISDLLLLKKDKGSYEPGEQAVVNLGSAWSGLPVTIRIIHSGAEIISSMIRLERWSKVEVPILPGDFGNVVLQISAVRDNRTLSQTMVLPVPWKNKTLLVDRISFDSVVEPGQNLDWSLRVTDADGTPVEAEVTAVLYDASLDKLNPHEWFLPEMPQRWYPEDPWTWRMSDIKWLSMVQYPPITSAGVPSIPWFYLNSFRYPQFGGRVLRAQNMESDMMSREAGNPAPAPPATAQAKMEDQPVEDQPGQEQTSGEALMKIRKNFDETAFFFPQMKTKSTGEVELPFTMPDAYTRWKWMIIAHTPQMAAVIHTESVESRLDLMLFPNLPRIVRSGDLIEWPVKIVNTSNENLPAVVRLDFFNVNNREPLPGLTGQPERHINLEAHESEFISWMVQIPADYIGVLGCTLRVQSGAKGDQEERLIPVLTNQTLVTDTYPFYMDPNTDKTIEVDALKRIFERPELQLIGYQMDWTADPAWLVLPALAYVQGQRHLTAADWAESAYSWILGESIVANPLIRQEIANWPVETLKSPLEGQDEVKAVLLRETPWVLDASSETWQMQQIKGFLEPNTVAYQKVHSLEQLQSLQNGDGGFSWCPQGNSDVWMTIYVMDILSRLHSELDWHPADTDWISEALAYIDRQMERNIQLDPDRKHITSLDVKALSVLTRWSDVRTVPDSKWIQFALKVLPEQWIDLPLQLQAYAGELLRKDHPDVSKTILESLLERSIVHPELGRYWKSQPGYSWEHAPIATQAAIIQFMRTMQVDESVIRSGIQWLLKNKQTNHWDSGSDTYVAIQAIWTGTRSLPVSSVPLAIRVGNWTAPAVIRGEKRWDPTDIGKDMQTVTVTNKGGQIAWGGIYVQSLQPLSAVQAQRQEGVVLQRLISEMKGQEIVPLSGSAQLAKGARIRVRLTLKTDRDLDYVYIKDLRAAGLEPVDQRSGYHWQQGLSYYQVVRDEAQEFFLDHVRPGTHIIEFDAYVSQYGTYEAGYALMQCLYAPAFAARTDGKQIRINPVQ